jgi:hypothetical protein
LQSYAIKYSFLAVSASPAASAFCRALFVRRRQCAESFGPFLAVDRAQSVDHRRHFFENRVKKRIAIFLGALEQRAFHIVDRTRLKGALRVCHDRSSSSQIQKNRR